MQTWRHTAGEESASLNACNSPDTHKESLRSHLCLSICLHALLSLPQPLSLRRRRCSVHLDIMSTQQLGLHPFESAEMGEQQPSERRDTRYFLSAWMP
jgi:hypothetical protein